MSCGKCKYSGWGEGIKMICRHPQHVKIVKEKEYCDDYLDNDFKDLQGQQTFIRPLSGLNARRELAKKEK